MRQTRNDTPFYYCLYKENVSSVDEYGNETGEPTVIYESPVLMYANISPATGAAQTEQFGNLENYDKVIVTTWMDCPIDENSVLFIDKEPDETSVQTYIPTAITTVAGYVTVPTPDYIVRSVAKSLNSISIAVRKVKVS